MVCAIMPWSHGKVNENPPVVADVLIACEGYSLYEHWTRTHTGLPFTLMNTYPSSRNLPAVRASPASFLIRIASFH
jgi:hypothetical protein